MSALRRQVQFLRAIRTSFLPVFSRRGKIRLRSKNPIGKCANEPRIIPRNRWRGDKGCDTRDFVKECRHMGVTPHVAQNVGRRGGSAIDSRTTRHAGYAISQRKRKRIEECFGWLKTIALLRKVRYREIHKVRWIFTLACAAYNLVRMRNLPAQVSAA